MIINANSDKYSISAMCRCLNISRKAYYYKIKESKVDSHLENSIITIFKESRSNYGTRKIKHLLQRDYTLQVSRRLISKIMFKYSLISSYTTKKYKSHKAKTNHDNIKNIVNQNFNNQKMHHVIISDLTYVNIKGKWNYICTLIDLFNREIVGYALGTNKNAVLIENAFMTSSIPLKRIKIFHTDRGSEFKNKIIDNILMTFDITRSLSKKGCPYDNAVAEATFKVIKTEFIKGRIFESLEQLRIEFFDYVNWYNTQRIHGSLNYLTPIAYRMNMSI